MDRFSVWLMFGLGALCIAGAIGWQVHAFSSARSWPSASAHVESSSIAPASLGRRGGEGYEPRIVYRYSVGGRTHTGRAIWLDPFWGQTSRTFERRAEAEAVLRAYPAGATVRVFMTRTIPSAPHWSSTTTQPV